MKKYIFLYTIVFTTALFAQGMRNRLNLEPIIEKNDSLFTCYLSYKIPYQSLVFVKNGNGYDGGVKFQFEIYKDDKVVKRESSEAETIITDYKKSTSSDLFLFGFAKFKLDTGKYSIKPIFKINNTQREGLLRDISIEVKNDSNSLAFAPIAVRKMNKNEEYLVSSHGNQIPYSINSYDLFVRAKSPITKVHLIQDAKIINNVNVKENEFFKLFEENDRLKLISSNEENVYSYILNNVNQKLSIGEYKLVVFTDKDSVEFEGKVEWFEAPYSLSDPEFAIEVLELVFSKDDVEQLLDYPEEEYNEALNAFWAKYDRNKETKFNELMYEFYNRVDYAIKEFKSVNKRNGAESAMGKVFIKFGEPDNKERTYSDNYKTVEVWKYNSLNKEFIFVDKNGLGNFELVN